MLNSPRFGRIMSSILAVAAVAIQGAASVANAFSSPAVTESRPSRTSGGRRTRRPGQGFGNRHVQRMKTKRQNKARNKAACRRRGH